MQEGEITGHHNQESCRFDDMEDDSADICNNDIDKEQLLYREVIFRKEALERVQTIKPLEAILPLTNTVTILSDPVQ